MSTEIFNVEVEVDQYITPKKAAKELGITYHCLMSRLRSGKIKSVKHGWARFIHRADLDKAKKDANQKNMVKTAR